jgi:hypothetical protein
MRSILNELFDLLGEIAEVNPVSGVLFFYVVFIPAVILSVPIDLIRVLVSKLVKQS